MPYKSDAQRRFFHTETAKQKGITPEMVKEYDSKTKGKTLPEKLGEAAAFKDFANIKNNKAPNPFEYKDKTKDISMEHTNNSTDSKLYSASESNLPVVR